ncbi:FAD:protein FMN transferase [Prosthecobacter dejongeii]|uniref:FAD:protein FMN transferase n=1 Tax=Prosthecobacter dejongeii TaxID=48465 RepID=A0A7W7YKB7_9BACT|nr:FAD:protein FMN transferase [Prosthecobacter dejongeii]MBB5037781.1 thiamine biosynthesis lipoprotein [Prosthecobacter dejongeii]
MNVFFTRLARLAVCGCLGLAGCGGERPPALLQGSTMGTTWSLQIADSIPETTAQEIATVIRQDLQKLEAELSHWQADSDLTRWNQNLSTEWKEVPAALAETVALAQRISQETDEALDVTLAPLVALWGFNQKERRTQLPTEPEIQAALALVGWDKLEVETQPPRLKKHHPRVQINVAAVTEGYAMDLLNQKLQDRGLKNFLLELGGEVLARGNAPDGHPWRVGVQAPDGDKAESLETLALRETCIATSGSYRHRFEKDGRTYSHLLDPRTGRPIEHRLVSVSVLHPQCALADGYATALMVLGPEKGRQVAQKLGLRVIWLEEP